MRIGGNEVHIDILRRSFQSSFFNEYVIKTDGQIIAFPNHFMVN